MCARDRRSRKPPARHGAAQTALRGTRLCARDFVEQFVYEGASGRVNRETGPPLSLNGPRLANAPKRNVCVTRLNLNDRIFPPISDARFFRARSPHWSFFGRFGSRYVQSDLSKIRFALSCRRALFLQRDQVECGSR